MTLQNRGAPPPIATKESCIKGGSRSTPKTILAQRITALKRSKVPKLCQIQKILTDPVFSGADIMKNIHALEKRAGIGIPDSIKLIELKLKLHEQMFGKLQRNLNATLDAKDVKSMMMKFYDKTDGTTETKNVTPTPSAPTGWKQPPVPDDKPDIPVEEPPKEEPPKEEPPKEEPPKEEPIPEDTDDEIIIKPATKPYIPRHVMCGQTNKR